MEFEKVYGIVGENGASKTTLFRCIYLESYNRIEIQPLKNHLGLLLKTDSFLKNYRKREYKAFV